MNRMNLPHGIGLTIPRNSGCPRPLYATGQSSLRIKKRAPTLAWIAVLTCCSLTLTCGCTSESVEPDSPPATTTSNQSGPSVTDETHNSHMPRMRTVAVADTGASFSQGPGVDTTSEAELALRAEARAAFVALMATDTSPEDWEAQHMRIVELGESSVPVLAEKLSSNIPFERETASSLLALLGPLGVDAADAIALAMQDPSGFVRANAAAALAQIPGRGEETIPVFAKLVLADDPQLRRMATTNLATFGPPAPALVANLTEALQGDDIESLLPAVELLGRIGPSARAALPRLQQIAFETTSDPSLRSAAQQAVAQIEATP